MHGLVSQDALCIRAIPYVVDLNGHDLVCGNAIKYRNVYGLVCSHPVPCIENQLCVLAIGCLYDCPSLFHVGNAAVGHRLYTDDVLACSVAELL